MKTSHGSYGHFGSGVCGFTKIKTRFLRKHISGEGAENPFWPEQGRRGSYGDETTGNLDHFAVRFQWATSRASKIPYSINFNGFRVWGPGSGVRNYYFLLIITF